MSQIARHIPDGFYSETVGRNINSEDTVNLSFFIQQRSDVLMSHGVADKNYLFMRDADSGKRLLNDFADVLVPGEWLKARLLNAKTITLTEEQIHVVGWPRMDYLLKLKDENSRDRNSTRGKAVSGKRVLWAPTHNYRKRGEEQESTSSYPAFKKHSRAMTERYDFKVSVHPRNRWRKKPTGELLVKSDVVISDFGTLVYEAWSLGIPVVFPRWILKDRIIEYTPNSAEAYIFENDIGLHAHSFEELCEMADAAIGISSDVSKFMDEYLPGRFLGCSGSTIANLLGTLEK